MSSPYVSLYSRLEHLLTSLGIYKIELELFERELRDHIWRETVVSPLLRLPRLFFAWLMASILGPALMIVVVFASRPALVSVLER